MPETEDLEFEEAKDETKEDSGRKKIIIIMAIVGVILLGVAVGITLFFTGTFEAGETEEVDVVEEGEEEEEEKRAEVLPAFYLDLKPEFVVNLEDTRYASFLSVNIQLMARDDEILEIVEAHMPVVRNNILSILASQPYEKLTSRKGKQQVREELLKDIQKIVAQGGDRPSEVDEEAEEDEDGEGEESEAEYDEAEDGEEEESEAEYGEDEEEGSEEEGDDEYESDDAEGEGVSEVSNNVAAIYFTSFIMQ